VDCLNENKLKQSEESLVSSLALLLADESFSNELQNSESEWKHSVQQSKKRNEQQSLKKLDERYWKKHEHWQSGLGRLAILFWVQNVSKRKKYENENQPHPMVFLKY
jgi:hypothetical protein